MASASLDELVLAHKTTIHKARVGISGRRIPVVTQHYMMLPGTPLARGADCGKLAERCWSVSARRWAIAVRNHGSRRRWANCVST